jgi:ribose transport system substrate-binding protein
MNRTRKYLGSATALLLVATGAFNAQAASKPTVIMVGADIGDPFYQAMHCGMIAGAAKYKVNLVWTGTEGVEWQPELTAFNAAVTLKPAAIITAPFSPTAFIAPIAKAMKGKIPVVTVDGSNNKLVELQNIRTGNSKAGAAAGQAMGKLLNGQGEVAVVSFAADVPAQKERVDGFKAGIAKFPGIKLVAEDFGGADSAKSAQVTSAIIQAHPNLAGIFGTDSNDAAGVSSAVKAAGKRGVIKVIGYDTGAAAIADMKAGVVDGLIGQSPFQIGLLAVKTAAEYVSGKNKKPMHQVFTSGGLVTTDTLNDPIAKQYIYQGCKELGSGPYSAYVPGT